MTVFTVILAILFFGALIFIHELGHFLTARAFGVGVREFSIGFGPKLVSRVSKKSGIRYSLRLLPIGGYVSMVGEDALLPEDDAKTALCRKPIPQRFLVLSAGALMNILLGFILMAFFVGSMPAFRSCRVDSFVFQAEDGQYYRTYDNAYGYGLQTGDKILKIGSERVFLYDDLAFEILRVGNEPTDVTVLRDGVRTVVPDVVFPTYTERGLVFGDSSFLYPETVEKTLPRFLYQTVMQSFSTIRMIYESLLDTVTGRYGLAAVSGPVGVVEQVGETAKYGARAVLYMLMVLTMNLGIINLLPLPALDGGRLLFLLIEAVRGKPVKPEYEGYVHLAGMVLLLLFMAVVTFQDVARLIKP